MAAALKSSMHISGAGESFMAASKLSFLKLYTTMHDFSADVPFWDRDTVPGKPVAIMRYRVDFDGMQIWTDQAFGPGQWLAYAVRNFDQVLREGREGNPKMMSLGLDLQIMGGAGRIWALGQCFAHVRKHDDRWGATRHQIASGLAVVDPA